MNIDTPKLTEEEARRFFSQSCDFVLAAAGPEQFPPGRLPEVAFIGRSNVGKSSLINALVGRKNLVRTSSTPGRTQQVVFFNLGNRMMLVDLPGYGHAQAPVSEKEQWNYLVQHYLRHGPSLKCVCLLVDGRHGTKSNDLEMMEFLDRAGVVFQTILTKADKVKASELAENTEQVRAVLTQHPAAREQIFVTSSDKKQGITELRQYLAGFAV